MTTPTIPNGASFMAASLYTGTGSTGLAVSNLTNSVGFQPDFLWIKSRNTATNHMLVDSVRGVTKVLESDTTQAEGTSTGGSGILTFDTSGFTNGTDTSTAGSNNASGRTYVAWQWKAGGSAVSNTNGTITSSVSANTTSGFSIVTYTSTTGTVGHGLGVAPAMIIIKPRNNTDQWTVGHVGLGGWQYGIPLNTTAATQTNTGFWNSTAPTSSVFSVGSWSNGFNMVAYCWAPIAGYSAFGSYTGNGSADGPFVYLGFRPRFIMIKRTDAVGNWEVLDSSRNPSNAANLALYPNLSNVEDTSPTDDFLSNGFKIRTATDSNQNTSGGTYIYAAFAENPFKYANAR